MNDIDLVSPDWDPMREEYEDPNINCYEHGPGVNMDVHLQRPAYRDQNNKKVVKLYVSNIPLKLSQIGLENLFLNFGNPTSVSKILQTANGRGHFAFIEYENINEARSAIEGLDKRPPFNILVTFARSDATRERLQQQKNVEAEARRAAAESQKLYSNTVLQPQPGPSLRSPLLRDVGLGRGKLLVKAFLSSNSRCCSWSGEDSDIRNPENLLPGPNRFSSSNNVLQSLVVMSTNGARKVAMGRAYIAPNPTVANDSQRPFTMESQGVYRQGEDVVVPAQKCSACNRSTALKCLRCGEPYCSKKCQKQDFPTHKSKCTPKMSIDITMDGSSEQRSIKVATLSQNMDPMEHSVQNTNGNKIASWGRPDKHTLEFVSAGESSVLRVMSKNFPTFIGILSSSLIAEETQKLVLEMPEYLGKQPHDDSYRPAEGALVGVFYENSYWRGFILSAACYGTDKSYQVALCDRGIVVTVPLKSIYRLPIEYHELPELTVKCNVLEFNYAGNIQELWNTIDEDKDYFVNIEDDDDNFNKTATIIKDGKPLVKVSLEQWDPVLKLRDLTVTKLEPSCRVMISAYHDQHAIYVRRIGKSFQEDLFKILQRVAAVHVTAPPLGRAPYKGEMVACQYVSDKNYYRAVVCSKTNEEQDEYLVCFIDFGNVASVKTNHMKALPEDLKMLPCLAVKVSLKGVPAQPLTLDAIRFLNSLMQREQELVLEYQGDFDSAGVELFLQKSSVNAEINNLLLPEWKRAVIEGQEPYREIVYMLEDIKVLPLLRDGSNTSKVRVLIMNILRDGRLCVCPVDQPEAEHVAKTLSYQINEYCESFDPSCSYCPRDKEICLAKYTDGLWYRAVSIQTTSPQSCEVMFLDYGNVDNVNVHSIRRMVEDFVQTPCLISLCVIDGLPETPTTYMTERVTQLVNLQDVYTVDVLHKYEDGEYKIHIPEVSRQLQSEAHH